MLGIFIGLLPWLLGGVVSLVVFRNRELNVKLLAFSAGTLLGNELLVGLAISLTYLQISVLKPWFIYSLVTLLSLSALIAFRAVNTPAINRVSVSALQFALITLTLAVTISALMMNTSIPTAGWDSLDYWAPVALDFIGGQTSSPVKPWTHDGTHPSTVAIISAWWAYWTYELNGLSLPYPGWWCTWLSLLLAAASFTHFFSRSLTASLLALYITASIPLLENHVAVGGYAELFLVAHLIVSASLLATGAATKDAAIIVMGLVVCLGCTYIKNIGYLYSALLLVAAGILAAGLLPKRAIIFMTLLSGLGLYCASLFIGQSFEVGNRIITIGNFEALQIVENEFYSLMVNASFGFIPELLLVGIASLFLSKPDHHYFDAIPVVAAYFIFLALCASQIMDYGLRYALPNNDTGNSRFSLTFIGLACLSIPSIYNRLFSGEGAAG